MVVFGREPTLPLEHDIRVITDGSVGSVEDRLKRFTDINTAVRSAVT